MKLVYILDKKYFFLGFVHYTSVRQLARENNMDGRVHTVAFGASTQMTEVEHALKDCMLTGYWLVLQNAHLAEEWGPELLELIKVISIIFCSRNKQEMFQKCSFILENVSCNKCFNTIYF